MSRLIAVLWNLLTHSLGFVLELTCCYLFLFRKPRDTCRWEHELYWAFSLFVRLPSTPSNNDEISNESSSLLLRSQTVTEKLSRLTRHRQAMIQFRPISNSRNSEMRACFARVRLYLVEWVQKRFGSWHGGRVRVTPMRECTATTCWWLLLRRSCGTPSATSSSCSFPSLRKLEIVFLIPTHSALIFGWIFVTDRLIIVSLKRQTKPY